MANKTKSTIPGNLSVDTELVVAGREPFRHDGFVNTPIVRGSTVLSPTVADLEGHTGRYSYGRRGNPTVESLEIALTRIEGGAGVVLTPSGLSAVSLALLAVLKAGDHLLMVDSAYQPTRRVCDEVLTRYGIETTYYDPLLGSGIASLVRPNTRAIFLESPGSQSFEIQDVPAIVDVASQHDIVTLMDNTWATPLFFRPHDFGVDISIQAGTKYLGGHSDLNIGTISANARTYRRVHLAHGDLGITVAPEDAFLASRGLRTMAVRLERHQQSALTLAHWLSTRPEVRLVLHPALPQHPGHALWKRDFKGASGLFSIILQPVPKPTVDAFLDALSLFGLGYSWGGFESLAIPFDCSPYRSATHWAPGGPAIRLQIGLEDPADLVADLDSGFAAMAAAG
ncbi:cystathionine beta-lyase [Ancylobacter dichloromethanicus]|uniref:Cystathionine beta-lyase n=1 Tax=Ancylobacter dichloromethanicus TaxID=518825 RepID=A0A9W6JC40_9HYPH|nr:cystathionine beta-lyase [Ancylobacter dichloromethanicus]MBS7555832.1 cystathionine beta-lyase [Ancylobacter dichloromethanicus]GLK72908.1 cystathionine beta-lyase [Ancylobacter dichloromethanicus]